jgi:hypothetical protein
VNNMGLLNAFKQYVRDAMPGGALNPEVTYQGLLDSAALGTAPVPIVGDVLGLLADGKRLRDNPEERTLGNYGLSALGLLPFVPAMGTIKSVAKAPQADALDAAQKNAVKMLGLPPNNTPMDRAKALDFHREVFRGTNADEKVAKLSKGMMGDAHYSGLVADVGNDYAGEQVGANVMPLMVRGRLASNREMADIVQEAGWPRLTEELGKRGFSGVADTKYELAAAVKNPAAVRSRFAAFDPARINENDLLGRVNLPMLGLLGAGGLGGAYLLRPEE